MLTLELLYTVLLLASFVLPRLGLLICYNYRSDPYSLLTAFPIYYSLASCPFYLYWYFYWYYVFSYGKNRMELERKLIEPLPNKNSTTLTVGLPLLSLSLPLLYITSLYQPLLVRLEQSLKECKQIEWEQLPREEMNLWVARQEPEGASPVF